MVTSLPIDNASERTLWPDGSRLWAALSRASESSMSPADLRGPASAEQVDQSASVVECAGATVTGVIERVRSIQQLWFSRSLRDRLSVLRALRLRIASNPLEIALTVPREMVSQTLAAEVLPLLDAIRFLEKESRRILKERRVRARSRPGWLWGNRVRVRPEPLGVILVIGPSNYPLMLPGIPMLQALAAGNGVILKPAPGCRGPLQKLVELAESCGVPAGLVELLPEELPAVTECIRLGVDKVILTGSANTGRAVLRELAETGTPSVMELSGCDSVFVLNDANLQLVTDCLLFGFTLNDGRTCMAPRRVFAEGWIVDRLIPLLRAGIEARRLDQRRICGPFAEFAMTKIREAVSEGALLCSGTFSELEGAQGIVGPVILDGVNSAMSVARTDIFAPVLSFVRVANEDEAVRRSRECPYGLGATVFGSVFRCKAIARRLDVGCVVINDLIVPSADPRVAFGGRRASGFGMTRGAAGLLEMTQVKQIIRGRPFFRPHLEPPSPVDADVLEALIRLEHAPNGLAKLLRVPGMVRASLKQFLLRRAERRSSE